MQKRNVLNSPRLSELKKHRRRVFLIKISLFIFTFLLVFVCLIYISRIPALNISGIEIVGNKTIDAEMIKTAVEKEIAGNYLWFFPKTNILYYPQNNIKKELQNKSKRLKDIDFSINNSILLISPSLREAKYLWCKDELSDLNNNNQKCYFMDEVGYIFDEAPYFSGEVYFKFYGSALVGTYFFKENFQQLIYFKDILTTMGLKPVSLSIGESGDIKVFLSNFNLAPTEPYLTFKIDADFKKLAENLETAIGTEPLLSNLKNKYSSLEYIDLRFGNKVYYKFSAQGGSASGGK